MTTISSAVYHGATPSSTGVPEGWYTTVTVCDHCGPKPTTVTLTKPSNYPTAPASSVVEHAVTSEVYPAASSLTAYSTPAASTPAAVQSAQPYVPEKPASKASEEEATSTLYRVVTQTIVPVPSTEIPYATGNGTTVSAPIGTGSVSGTGSTPYSTYSPIPFEGGASRFQAGVSGVAMLVAGLLVL